MKLSRTLTLITCIVSFSTAFGQDISEHAIGLRMGDSDGFGSEISYQKSLSRHNRLEVGLGWRDTRHFNAFKFSGIFQWVYRLENNLNWYYGVGGGLGNVDFENVPNYDSDNDGLFIFGAGDIGIEYNFGIPLLISFDFRPEIGLVGYDGFSDNFDFDIALGIRYQF